MRLEFVAANHGIVHDGNKSTLFSYDSCVAQVDGGKVLLGPNWDYSRTTMKYVGQFLGTNAAETRKLIETGEYKTGVIH